MIATRKIEVTTPPLENGDRLTREEFEIRYTAMPELKKAELNVVLTIWTIWLKI